MKIVIAPDSFKGSLSALEVSHRGRSSQGLQTVNDKTPIGVAKVAKERGIPVLAVVVI